MEDVVIIAITLGSLAGLLLLIGVLVCAVRAYSSRNDKFKNNVNQGPGTIHEKSALPNGHLPHPMMNDYTSNVIYDTGNHVKPAIPSLAYVDNTPPTMVQPLEATSAAQTASPLIMNPAALDGNTSVISIDQSGYSVDRVVLNQANATNSTPITLANTNTNPLGQATYTNAAPSRVEILNRSAQVQPGPIVPEQAVLLYPSLPAPAPTPIYPNLSSLPAPGPVANGYLAPAGPGRLTLSGRAFTDTLANSSILGTSTLPARGPVATQVTGDGFTVYPSRGASNLGYNTLPA